LPYLEQQKLLKILLLLIHDDGQFLILSLVKKMTKLFLLFNSVRQLNAQDMVVGQDSNLPTKGECWVRGDYFRMLF
jgi:hypothetical protein